MFENLTEEEKRRLRNKALGKPEVTSGFQELDSASKAQLRNAILNPPKPETTSEQPVEKPLTTAQREQALKDLEKKRLEYEKKAVASFNASENKGLLYNLFIGGNEGAREKFMSTNKDYAKMKEAEEAIKKLTPQEKKSWEDAKLDDIKRIIDIPASTVDYVVKYGTASIKEPGYALAGLGKGFKNKVNSLNSLFDEQVGLRIKDVFDDKTHAELLKEYRENKNKTPEEIYQEQLISFKKEADKGNKSAKIVYDNLLKTGKPLTLGKTTIENMKEYKNIEAGNLTETQEMASDGGQAVGGLLPTVAATAINPYLGKAVFFGGAQYDYAQEALARGKTEKEAQIFGVVMAGFETLTEKLGFGKLGPRSLLQMVKSGGSEMLQEGLMPTFEALTNKIMFNENIEDLPNHIEESFKQGIGGLFLGFVMDGARGGISSAMGIKTKLDNGETVTQAEIEKTIEDIKTQTGKDFELETEQAISNLVKDLVKKGELTPKTTVKDIITPQAKVDLTKPLIDNVKAGVEIETNKLLNKINELKAEKAKYEKVENYELAETTNIKINELESQLDTINADVAKAAKIIKLKTSDTYKSLDSTVEKMGFKLRLDENIEKGQINMDTKEITLNPLNPEIFHIAAHEFTHIFDVNSNEYKQLLQIALNTYDSQNKLEGLKADIIKEHGYDNEVDINNEIIAYFTEYNLFKNQTSIETVFNTDRKAFDTLHGIIKKFKDIFNKEQHVELNHIRKQLNEAEKLYTSILKKSLVRPKKVLKTEPKLPTKEAIKPGDKKETVAKQYIKKEVKPKKIVEKPKSPVENRAEQLPTKEKKKAPQRVIQEVKDNKSITLTKESSVNFKDSKVTDNKGNLLAVYHGTPNKNFDAFTKDKINSGAELRGTSLKGYYFTDNKISAENYSVVKGITGNEGIKTAYLNMTNPLVIDITNEQNASEIRNEYNFRKNKPITQTMINNYINLKLFNDSYLIGNEQKRQDYFKSTNYDGVIIKWRGNETEYIVFEPTQIKEVKPVQTSQNAIKNPIIKELSKPVEKQSLQGREAIAAQEKAARIARNQALAEKGKVIDVNNQPVVVKDAEKGFSKMDFAKKKKLSKEDEQITALKKAYAKNKKLSKQDADLFAELNVDKILKHDIVKFSIGSEYGELDTGNKLQLSLARQMEKNGKSSTQIWYATGWQRNKFDNIWRFEIPDGDLKDNLPPGTYKLSDIYRAEQLYKAYPVLKDVNVIIEDLHSNFVFGAYRHSNKTIKINSRISKTNRYITLIHELQHAIQYIDGLPAGGNTNVLTAMYNILNKRSNDGIIDDKLQMKELYEIDFHDIYQALAGELEATNVGDRALKTGHRLPLNDTQKQVKRIYSLDDLYNKLNTRYNISTDEILQEAREIAADKSTGSNIKYSKEIDAVIDYDVKSRKEVMKDLETTLQLDTINFDNVKSDKHHGWTHPFKIAELVFEPKEAAYINTHIMVDPVIKNEAAKKRFTIKEKKEIDTWGIKKKSKESAALQKYGEGEYLNDKNEVVKYTKEDLMKEFPNSYQKISDADKLVRSKYTMYLNAMNEVRAKYGYEPIAARENYYKHFREVSGFAKTFGLTKLLSEPNINTELVAHATQMKKNIPFVSAQLERTGLYTTYDAITGLDKYINEMSNLLFHTQDIQNIRYLASYIGSKYGKTMLREIGGGKTKTIQSDHLARYVMHLNDYADSLAGKQNDLDLAVEKKVDSRIYNAALWLKRQVGGNLTALKLTSAATNAIPAVQTAAMSDQIPVARAIFDTLANIVVNDGFEQSNDFLTIRTAQEDVLWDKMSYNKAQKFGQIFMETTDVISANLVVRMRYYHYLKRGYSEEAANKKAGIDASKIIGGRSMVELPAAYKSKVLGIVNQFTLEPVNQMRVLTTDIMNKNYAAEDLVTVENVARYNNIQKAKIYIRLLAYTYVFGALFRELFGRDPTVNPIGTLERAYKHLNNPNLTEGEKSGMIITDITRQIPFADLVTGGGKLPVIDVLPDIEQIQIGRKSWEDEIINFALHTLLPTGGGAVNNMIRGAQTYTYDEPGVYNKSGGLKFPVKSDMLSKFRNVILGPNTTREAQNYYDNKFQPLTAKQTEYYFKSGLPIKEYREYIRDINKIENTVNSVGRELEGTSTLKKINYIQRLPIKPREKAVLLEYLKRR